MSRSSKSNSANNSDNNSNSNNSSANSRRSRSRSSSRSSNASSSRSSSSTSNATGTDNSNTVDNAAVIKGKESATKATVSKTSNKTESQTAASTGSSKSKSKTSQPKNSNTSSKKPTDTQSQTSKGSTNNKPDKKSASSKAPATPTRTSTTTTTHRRRSARTRQEDPVVYPGFGTYHDLKRLAAELSSNDGNNTTVFPTAVVEAIMTSRGRGLRGSAAADGSAPAAAALANPWADFMQEVGTATTTAATSATTTTSASKRKAEAAAATTTSAATTKRVYVPPAEEEDDSAARSAKAAKKSQKKNTAAASRLTGGGRLVQTGSLDSRVVGRKTAAATGEAAIFSLFAPTHLLPGICITRVFTGCNAVHSWAVANDGTTYAWGRNEAKQLTADLPDQVFYPTAMNDINTVLSDRRLVQVACGKSHSVLLLDDGSLYAVGSNKLGQCGVKASMEAVPNLRKCVFDDDTTDPIRQVAAGEDFTVLITTTGRLYSTGSAEFGKLGNGETGEYFVTANKIAFANCHAFSRRTTFCHAPQEKLHTNNDSSVKVVPLPDSSDVRIGAIAVGKHHSLAVEWAAPDHIARVFSWGCGNYGVLGHGVQADEYYPRLIGVVPLQLPGTAGTAHGVAAGAHCSLLRNVTNGHVWYWGKHRSVGEAVMRPQLVDALAHNAHVVTHCGGGGQTVVCSTAANQTVAWGQGPHGELGLGTAAKSSAKPTFVTALEGYRVLDLACGYGHTLWIVPDEEDDDEDDEKHAGAAKPEPLPELDLEDVADAIESAASTAVPAESKPKKRGRAKKS